MGRPKKPPPVEREPRSFTEIMNQENMALDLYFRTGGGDIDMTIEALKNTMVLYDGQRKGIDGGPDDPNVTPYEARMTAAKIATLNKQREYKLKYCRGLIDEAARYEEKRAQQAAKPPAEPGAEAPGDCEDSGTTRPAPLDGDDATSRRTPATSSETQCVSCGTFAPQTVAGSAGDLSVHR